MRRNPVGKAIGSAGGFPHGDDPPPLRDDDVTECVRMREAESYIPCISTHLRV